MANPLQALAPPSTADLEWSESVTRLVPALMAVQSEIRSFRKNRKVEVKTREGKPSHSYNYAELSKIVKLATPILHANGLLVLQPPGDKTGHIVVNTVIFHTSGEWVRGRFALPVPPSSDKENPVQKAGGGVSFVRRYAYSGTLGIPTDDDNDAREYGERRPEREPKREQKPAEPQTLAATYLQAAAKSKLFADTDAAYDWLANNFATSPGQLTPESLAAALAKLRAEYTQRKGAGQAAKEESPQRSGPPVTEADRKRLQSSFHALLKERGIDKGMAYWVGLKRFGWVKEPSKREDHGVSMGASTPTQIQECTRFLRGLDDGAIAKLSDEHNFWIEDQNNE